MPAPDTRQSIFDPGMDVATVVFSHVQCVKTRVNLSLVSKLWRDASKTAAAYPLEFDFDAFSRIPSSRTDSCHFTISISMMDNDEALSLPYERVVGLLGCEELAETERMQLRCSPGECKAAEVGASERPYLECKHVRLRSHKWTLARSPVLARERVPLVVSSRAIAPPYSNTGTVCSTRWITSAREWEKYAKEHAEHLR